MLITGGECVAGERGAGGHIKGVIHFDFGPHTSGKIHSAMRFHKENKYVPPMHWAHGTLWIDTNDESDIETIRDVMESEVLNKGFAVNFHLLKATGTEPWDQWAMDVVDA